MGGHALYRTIAACRATGASFRQADYWERTGALVPTYPARGSGTQRLYTADEVRLLAVCTALASVGANTGIMGRVVEALRGHPSEVWPSRVTVDPDGRVGYTEHAGNMPVCWLLDLDACAAVVAREVQPEHAVA